jgi:hypothetical protein
MNQSNQRRESLYFPVRSGCRIRADCTAYISFRLFRQQNFIFLTKEIGPSCSDSYTGNCPVRIWRTSFILKRSTFCLPKFRRIISPPSAELNTKPSKIPAWSRHQGKHYFKWTTRYYIPEARTLHKHRCENLKCYPDYSDWRLPFCFLVLPSKCWAISILPIRSLEVLWKHLSFHIIVH